MRLGLTLSVLRTARALQQLTRHGSRPALRRGADELPQALRLAAERRWKGDHDCKAYLAAYGEALQRCELSAQLSIRFSCDVPQATRARRALEQQLIQRWWPPFNKETRQRWATPFTAEL